MRRQTSHAAGRITLPLRHNGTPYRGINILLLWGEAMANGYASPLWMNFKQALALDAHVRKGEHGAMVVFADRFTGPSIRAASPATLAASASATRAMPVKNSSPNLVRPF